MQMKAIVLSQVAICKFEACVHSSLNIYLNLKRFCKHDIERPKDQANDRLRSLISCAEAFCNRNNSHLEHGC